MKKSRNIIISIIVTLFVVLGLYIAFLVFYAKPETLEAEPAFTVEDIEMQ